jgi:hypothetical protein
MSAVWCSNLEGQQHHRLAADGEIIGKWCSCSIQRERVRDFSLSFIFDRLFVAPPPAPAQST